MCTSFVVIGSAVPAAASRGYTHRVYTHTHADALFLRSVLQTDKQTSKSLSFEYYCFEFISCPCVVSHFSRVISIFFF